MPRSLPVIQEKARPWYAGGLKFRCTGCGNCCTGPTGYVWISPEEVEGLARHLGRPLEEVQKRFCRKIGNRISLRERKTLDGKYDCIFLVDLPAERSSEEPRRGCGIYEARPLQCRTWPFWEGVIQTRRSWQSAARNCPGIDQGKHYSRRRIEAFRDAREWPESPPSSD